VEAITWRLTPASTQMSDALSWTASVLLLLLLNCRLHFYPVSIPHRGAFFSGNAASLTDLVSNAGSGPHFSGLDVKVGRACIA
jgi:hypothetical protein